jgi:hypothetical protein
MHSGRAHGKLGRLAWGGLSERSWNAEMF